MVKRSRAAVRPGQRRPIQRRPPTSASPASASPAATPARPGTPARPAGGLTAAEAQRAEELEAQIRAEEQALETSRRAARDRARRAEVAPASGSLAAASHEYDYVARDIRRIGVVAALLLGILFVIWLLVEVVGVIRIT
jgi:hypothetical protein